MSEQTVPYLPVFELKRGDAVESLRFGAAAVVDAFGRLLAWYGDPQAVTFMRSSAKPFQVMPFIESGEADRCGLNKREISIMCSSHSGTEEHVRTLDQLQRKMGVSRRDLLCGTHYPLAADASDKMKMDGVQPTSNHHNCSGMHTAVLKHAASLAGTSNGALPGLDYIDPFHPVQKEILEMVAGMSYLDRDSVQTGIDGCSLPSFALPLYNAALAYARLCDPASGSVAPAERAQACRVITQAMMAFPEMVAGPHRFDTRLMETTANRLVSKGGADGVQALGLLPGALRKGSPGVGIFLKISDGDKDKTAVPAVALEILSQLGVLSPGELSELSQFGPELAVYNWRKIEVGRAYPNFRLEFSNQAK